MEMLGAKKPNIEARKRLSRDSSIFAWYEDGWRLVADAAAELGVRKKELLDFIDTLNPRKHDDIHLVAANPKQRWPLLSPQFQNHLKSQVQIQRPFRRQQPKPSAERKHQTPPDSWMTCEDMEKRAAKDFAGDPTTPYTRQRIVAGDFFSGVPNPSPFAMRGSRFSRPSIYYSPEVYEAFCRFLLNEGRITIQSYEKKFPTTHPLPRI